MKESGSAPGKNLLSNTAVVCLIALACSLLWGSAFPCIKIGYRLFQIGAEDTAAQILFAGMRFFLAGIIVIVLGSIMQHKVLRPERADLGSVLKLALFQTVLQYIFFYRGLAHAEGVKSSIITASNYFIAILIASLIFRMEKLNRRKIIGCLLGFAGVVIINLNGSGLDLSFRWDGEFFILLSAVSGAVSSVLIKQYSRKSDPVLLSGYQFALGGIVMMVFGMCSGGHLSWSGWIAAMLLLYMGGISAVAYTLWSLLLKHNPVSKVAVFGFMTPLCGVLLSAFLLGERGQAFSLYGLTALILVCAGIYIVNSESGNREGR